MMITIRSCLVILIFGLFFFGINAQEVSFSHFTVDHGLSQNSVVSITQDHSGYMWLATQDGLNQYDGHTNIKSNRFFSDVTQSNYSQLGKVITDEKGNIWISNLNGIVERRSAIYGKYDTIQGINFLNTLDRLNEDEYLIGTFGSGLFIYNEMTNSFDTISSPFDIVYSVIFIQKKNVHLISSEKGLYYFDNEKLLSPLDNTKSDINFSDIVIDQSGTIYLSSYGEGLFTLADDKLIQSTLVPNSLNIQDLHIDKSNNLWIASYGNGVYYKHNDSNIVSHFLHIKGDPLSLGYNDILCIYEDRNEIIWLGSDGGGVSYYNPNTFKFNALLNERVPPEINISVPRCLSVDRNNKIWIGTSGFGLTSYDPATKRLHRFENEPGQPNSLSGNRVMTLHHDSDGALWIGTQEKGLNIMHPNGVIRNVDEFNELTIWTIFPYEKNAALIGTRNNGLIIHDKKRGNLKTFNTGSHKNLLSNDIKVITSGPEGWYYLGTENKGVYMINPSTEEIVNGPSQLSETEIKSLHFDNKYLWIGTAKEGIFYWEIEKNHLGSISEKEGLPNNVVYSILPDEKNQLWISTNKGICSFNKGSIDVDSINLLFTCYDTNDGLQGMEFNTGASFKSKDGGLYFGGLNGINWLNPNSIRESNSAGKPIINKIMVNNVSLEFDTLIYLKENFILKPDQNYFNIHYNIFSYNNTKPEFSHRLKGLQDNWTLAGNQSVANFTNVPPGDYTFEITTLNNQGNINYPVKAIKMTVRPAFWQTWWFSALGILSMLGLIAFIYKRRTNYLKRQKMIAEEIKELEMLVLRSQMNPHFIFNCLNSIKNYILQSDKMKAAEYLSDFAHMVRMILQNSREKEISLHEELESLKLYLELEKMRLKQEIEVGYFIDSTINLDAISIPPLLLQPYLENAIWHGLIPKKGKGVLHISILQEQNNIICRIDDNGIGRPQSMLNKSNRKKSYKSMGMGITQDRVNLHNKVSDNKIQIKVRDKVSPTNEPLGTTVDLILPKVSIN